MQLFYDFAQIRAGLRLTLAVSNSDLPVTISCSKRVLLPCIHGFDTFGKLLDALSIQFIWPNNSVTLDSRNIWSSATETMFLSIPE